ncbi:MAG: DNA topoisomerase VI, subunit B [Haloquadratum sp. J07HQX50]|nr:MAG: DNA topoisomerase VI, subunit B [Haloquadratum sp. J07HQX50]
MTSFQSSLDEKEGEIATELAESQRSISIAEFFEKNKHMLGFDSGARGLVTAVKEAVDNALDATEEAGIRPDISVEIRETGSYYTLIVEDNGPGITKEQLPKVFGKLLYGSRFHAREQSLPGAQSLLINRDGCVEFVPIGDFCDNYLPEQTAAVAPVSDDITVPSFNRQTQQISWQPVTTAIRHETEAAVYEVKTTAGRTVTVTGDHSLFCLSDSGEIQEVAGGELETGDSIMVPKQIPTVGSSSASDTTEQMSSVAALCSETTAESLSTDGGLQAKDATDPSPDRLQTLLRSLINESRSASSLSVAEQRALTRSLATYVTCRGAIVPDHRQPISVNSASSQTLSLFEMFDTCCTSDDGYTLPGFLFEVHPSAQRAFVAQAFAVDVSDESVPQASVSVGTAHLLRELTTLCTQIGLMPQLTTADAVDADSGHTLTICSHETNGPQQQSPQSSHHISLGSPLRNETIQEVTQVAQPDTVYDISVPGATGADENFIIANEAPVFVKNSRGQQGIGISAAVLYSQLTSGKPAKITSRTQSASQSQYFELIIDTDTNEPEIQRSMSQDPTESELSPTHGTRIELEMEANLRARQQLHDYIKHTAVVNPHARITLDEPNISGPIQYDRVDGAELPAETEEIRPHPHGVELGTLLKMLESTESYSLSGFLQAEFTRVGTKTTTRIVDRFRDRYFGREIGWSIPESSTDDAVESIIDAVANKPADATEAFATQITETVVSRERTTHQQLQTIIETIAEDIEDEYRTTFAATVRQRAHTAMWQVLTADLSDDIFELVEQATSQQKDESTLNGLTTRLETKLQDHDKQHRLTREVLAEYVNRSADQLETQEITFGETARGNVAEAFWDVMNTVNDSVPQVSAVGDDRDTASSLLEAMRETDILAPPTNCLSPISEELVEAGLRKEFDADFYAAATRDAEVHGGDPFVVEAGIAYGGQLDNTSMRLLRFANRVPLVYQQGACATTDVIKQIRWRNYGLNQPGGSGLPQDSIVLMIHVASTNVPFTSESKDALANIPAIENEIELAVREASRDLKSFLNKRRSMQKRRKKQDVLSRILPEMAHKLAEVTGRQEPDIDSALARIMNNVSIERQIEETAVTLKVRNHSDRNETPEITEIVSAEPQNVPDDVDSVNMDGEWFLTWNPTVKAGDTVQFSYRAVSDATFDIQIDGIETEKLTLNV